ncbi:MAG: TetR/AcrR family transcriptional regulator [Gammaproteobacteria bacterium]
MPPTEAQALPDEIREAILTAAQTRLLRFGYHKTTMVEIANEAGMSAANLYRYFKNKQDIVAECANRCIDDRLQSLRAIVRDSNLSPTEKLLTYAAELVADSHALTGSDSMIGELVDTITRERRDLLRSKHMIHYSLINEILVAGNTSGEFAVDDIDTCARNIFSAFALFDVPIFIGLYDRDEFDARAEGVVRLLLDGLRPKPAKVG